MRSSILSLLTIAALAAAPAAAQRREATPEQRIERLEKQVRQVQGRIFPKGQPVDTAGFSDEPAATQASVTALITRLDGVERQLAEIAAAEAETLPSVPSSAGARAPAPKPAQALGRVEQG